MDDDKKFSFSIDRGGTFTDVYAQCPGGKVRVMKLLSEDPASYPDAPREAIRRIIEEETGIKMQQSSKLDSKHINWIRMGTTVATNALLERKGEKCALVTTAGFKDLLHIGNQSRPNLFDLSIEMPDVIYEEVVEVDERVCLVQDTCQLDLKSPVVTGTTGEKLHVWKTIDKDKLMADLKGVLSRGIRSLAVVLLHSYTFSEHEEAVGALAREMGFTHVSLSSHVMPMVRIVPRGYTACADAYLTPSIQRYIQTFLSGFKEPETLRVLFMQSDGGLTPTDKFIGSRAIVSGPAGGVVGYAMTTLLGEEMKDEASNKPIIGFDMGGTSTDVSRFHGNYEHVFETNVAGICIQAPQLDINTVAAGGGSILSFRSGLFAVGPESAGANPGPACYGKGGPLTVTDANLCLGRLLPEYFPKIFGPNEDQPLDRKITMRKFQELTDQINEFIRSQPTAGTASVMSVQEVAMGFIRVANETMCRPIRALTQAKGYDTAQHVLACFGGAGGQHACAIARSLGMSTVFIHRYSGILSAYGLALADVVHESQEPCAKVYNETSYKYIDERIQYLITECVNQLQFQGFPLDSITTTPFLNMRYDRTDCAIMCTAHTAAGGGAGCNHGNFLASFNERYQAEFGFTIPARDIVIDDIRVRGVAKACSHDVSPLTLNSIPPTFVAKAQCFAEDRLYDTCVYILDHLTYGHVIQGPAIIIDSNSTIWVEPGSTASLTKFGDVKIEIGREGSQESITTELDTIHLSIFSHRFMSIAEQMGRVLQRTSISTNIKERLDFSCALFGPDGGLVANAPHIPVHLGAMQETVRYQMRFLGDDLRHGDVILCNHPGAGGSHLPDLTVITPVFYPGQSKPVFFVANRGHHADVGGISPGSVPPQSHHLWEEGMAVKSFKLVENGEFQESGCIELLKSPSKHPGSSGARNINDNLSDLRAQVAANQKGITLVKELIDAYGLDVVQSYMKHIQENAEIAVKTMLKEVAVKADESGSSSTAVLKAEDKMDDGTVIKVTISISKEDGSTTIDFSGTGKQVDTNCNAPRAVAFAALIYSLRCLVKHDIPLNQGCLAAISVNIPDGCILSPSDGAAVVGGNVQTSQRIVDVLLKAFSACAASQGCMNNIVFGDDSMVYYETVAGGAGAGPTWNGRSGVHTHMTNTRITDPEILERRFPVILKKFHLNNGTGGNGLFKGGDGVLRELMFRRSVTLCVLSERRVYAPYGLCGGEPGTKGANTLIKKNGEEVLLGGKSKVEIEPWETFRLETPGGGGYGVPFDVSNGEGSSPPSKKTRIFEPTGSISSYQRLQESA